MWEFHGRSRQRQQSRGLRIPLLQLLERFSSELWVRFHLVALNESSEHDQTRRLKKPKFREGKTSRL